MAYNVCAYLTFEWGRSKPDEQQIYLHNYCELWLLSEDPIQMWPNNLNNHSKVICPLQEIYMIENIIVRPERPKVANLIRAVVRCII